MAASSSSSRRLADLLVEPRETLEVELKGWLDITGNAEHKAVLAKAIIALANHGGGYVLIGFEKTDTGAGPASGRPATLADFNTDAVNAVVARYSEPPFHCDVTIEVGPDGLAYPIIAVPGGHTFPIRASRSGPNGETIKIHSYYIRRPGPASEVPQNGREWDGLVRRSIANAREELLDQLRSIIAGGAPAVAKPSEAVQATEWFEAARERWVGATSALPLGHPALMPQGQFSVGYTLSGDLIAPTLPQLKELITRATVRHTGWPEFWVPTREGIAPYVDDGAIECWIGRDGEVRDAAHADFWRATPDAKLFLIRGHQEDGQDYGQAAGTVFDLTMPTWRVGEAFLHAERMAEQFGDPDAEAVFVFEWTGLKGRSLAVHPSSQRLLFDTYRAQQDVFRTQAAVRSSQVSLMLPELVFDVLRPLYELFEFFQLTQTLVLEELAKMRKNQF